MIACAPLIMFESFYHLWSPIPARFHRRTCESWDLPSSRGGGSRGVDCDRLPERGDLPSTSWTEARGGCRPSRSLSPSLGLNLADADEPARDVPERLEHKAIARVQWHRPRRRFSPDSVLRVKAMQITISFRSRALTSSAGRHKDPTHLP